MPNLLQPKMFVSMTSVKDVQKLMKQDLKNAAKNSHGKDVFFYAAKDVPVGPMLIPIFIVTDKPKEWESAFKAKKITTSIWRGTCTVMTALDKKTTEIVIKKVAGGTRKDVVKLVDVALLKDPGFRAHDADEIADRAAAAALKQAQASKKPAAPSRPDPVKMAQQSFAQARAEGKIDRDFELDAATIERVGRLSHQFAEYQKFAASFTGFANKYKIAVSEKEAAQVWDSLLKALATSNYFDQFIPKDGTFNIFGEKEGGKIAREALLKSAMQGMQGFIQHADKYMDKVVAELRKAGDTPTWSFWSGRPADEAAKKENPGGVVLEGSIGSWFEEVWNFTPLSGVNNMAVWTALSELYAKKAAQYYNEFNFRGYVGPGATREQSVFNIIEQPTLIEVLGAKEQVGAPKVEWYCVDAEKDADGRWVLKGPSIKALSREDALERVADRYGS